VVNFLILKIFEFVFKIIIVIQIINLKNIYSNFVYFILFWAQMKKLVAKRKEVFVFPPHLQNIKDR